jgi:hypothetical protein
VIAASSPSTLFGRVTACVHYVGRRGREPAFRASKNFEGAPHLRVRSSANILCLNPASQRPVTSLLLAAAKDTAVR